MYAMKNIISLEKNIVLPKCMYSLKNPIEVSEKVTDINICEQVTKFLKKMPNNQLLGLEERQDKLLHKLDVLYERIKTISSLCALKNQEKSTDKTLVDVKQEEIVLVLNCDNLPWFLNIFLKKAGSINVSWHIHSTVHHSKVPKIQAFFEMFQDLYKIKTDSKINLRLIFKSESAAPELKDSTLGIPINGTVNIIRYLCIMYNNIIPYDYNNYEMDGLLDICHQIDNTSDNNKEVIIPKLFMHSNNWIFYNNLSIVDLAIFNTIKHMPNGNKIVPKQWLINCEKLFEIPI